MPFWRYAGPAGCYDQAQQDAVRSIMKSDAVVALSKKQPLYVKFDHVACRIDHAGPHVSFILLADAWSNQLLEGFSRSVVSPAVAHPSTQPPSQYASHASLLQRWRFARLFVALVYTAHWLGA
jgi:hypothetical protein